MSFYAVVICCSSRRVVCCAEVKYHIVKITTYIPRGLSVFFYTPLWSVAHRIFQSPSGFLCCVLARHPQDWLSLMVFPERSGGTIIQQCSMLCGADVFWLCDHAISGCYHPPVSHDSSSLQDFWDFSIWALTLPISEADGIFMQLKFSMTVADIRSLESGVQHTSLSPY